MNDLEKKRKNIELGVKLGAFALVGFLVAPFIFLAIKGLIGLLIAGGIAFTAMQFAPYFSMKIANWRLAAIKAEAAKDPISTLQNDYRFKQINLDEFGQSIKVFSAEVKQFESKVVSLAKQYPEEVPIYREQAVKMNRLLKLREDKYKEAQDNLRQYDMEIKKASTLWDMSQAALKLSKAAGESEDDFFSKIKSETALDSVQKSLNMAFADLEFALMEEDNKPKELPASNQKTEIILDNVEVKTKVKA